MLVYVSVVNMLKESTTLIEFEVSSAIHSAIEKDDKVIKSYFSKY